MKPACCRNAGSTFRSGRCRGGRRAGPVQARDGRPPLALAVGGGCAGMADCRCDFEPAILYHETPDSLVTILQLDPTTQDARR
jgi:hypothetical protein